MVTSKDIDRAMERLDKREDPKPAAVPAAPASPAGEPPQAAPPVAKVVFDRRLVVVEGPDGNRYFVVGPPPGPGQPAHDYGPNGLANLFINAARFIAEDKFSATFTPQFVWAANCAIEAEKRGREEAAAQVAAAVEHEKARLAGAKA